MAKASDVIDPETQDEPITTEPTQSRDDIRAAALEDAGVEAEGTEGVVEDFDTVLEEVAAKEDVTVEDLRRVGGEDADDLSDDELLAEWKKAQEGDEVKLPFPVYDAEGNKVTDISKLTLNDLLTGKVQIGYQAMGKEQKKALIDLIRTASLGHYNESKMANVMAERSAAYQTLQQLRAEHDAWGRDRQVWDRVLAA